MIETRPIQITKERYPLLCQWELTCRCNLHCVMCYTDCYNRSEKIRTELTTAEILRIMAELRREGCAELLLTGGEPLARPDFFEIYETAVRSGFLVSVLSNGTLVTEDVADRFAVLPPRRVEISLHGVTAETFEKVTLGKGSFEKCMQGIRYLLDRKIPVLLKATAMTLNRDEVLEVKKYAESLPGVRFHLGVNMVPTLAGTEEPFRFELPKGELDRMFAFDEALQIENCGRCEETPVCKGGKFKFHIDAYGGLELCSGNRRKSYDLRTGNFKEGFYQQMPGFPCPNKASSVGDLSPLGLSSPSATNRRTDPSFGGKSFVGDPQSALLDPRQKHSGVTEGVPNGENHV